MKEIEMCSKACVTVYRKCRFVYQKGKLYALLGNEYLLEYIDPLLIMDNYNNIAKD